ncbi:MAG: endolytic transglycosylase MltG [Candidatus Absconditabacterales bacterium]|nr:endolytic transglycosylase MltG [Candidatus Absconditabacterales bacterium]
MIRVLLGLCTVLVILISGLYRHATQSIPHTASIFVDAGSRIYSLLPSGLSPIQSLWRKYHIRRNPQVAESLHQGRYQFSGFYTVYQFLDHVVRGPENNLISVTILEGRSIYDIDDYLTSRGLITKGEYIQATTQIPSTKTRLPSNLVSLEGFLYPDTYFLDTNQPIIPQLIRVQLQAYEDKVITPLSGHIADALTRMTRKGVKMSPYEFLILASIIEKEEKNHENQARIGGLFVNRLKSNMRIDADISLCYNFKTPYTQCTTKKIITNLTDTTNLYNTRARPGLPPTPIANPSAETVRRLANRESHEYLYYLHDSHGNIYFGKTLADHNLNKSKYLGK